jgi:hypothetical protein
MGAMEESDLKNLEHEERKWDWKQPWKKGRTFLDPVRLDSDDRTEQMNKRRSAKLAFGL